MIVETSAIIRKGIIEILRRYADLRFEVFELAEIELLRKQVCWHTPDMLLINPSLPGMDLLRQLKKEIPGLKCVALASSLPDQSILKEYDEMISLYDSPEQIKEKLSSLSAQTPDNREENSLSPREKEVLSCVVTGMTNKQIADKLYLSTHTVITHRRNIASKLQIHSAAGLTIYAIVNKLVDIEALKNATSEND